MSDTFNITIFRDLKNLFVKSIKWVLKTKISKNPVKLQQYERNIIVTYNTITTYAAEHFSHSNYNDQLTIRKELLYVRNNALRCFGKLNLEIELPDDILEYIPIHFSDSSPVTEESLNVITTDEDNSDSDSTDLKNILTLESNIPGTSEVNKLSATEPDKLGITDPDTQDTVKYPI